MGRDSQQHPDAPRRLEHDTRLEVSLYQIGFGAVAVVLFWEHRIVAPNDLSRINRAFFDFNAYMSIVYFVATLADLVLISGAGTALQ